MVRRWLNCTMECKSRYPGTKQTAVILYDAHAFVYADVCAVCRWPMLRVNWGWEISTPYASLHTGFVTRLHHAIPRTPAIRSAETNAIGNALFIQNTPLFYIATPMGVSPISENIENAFFYIPIVEILTLLYTWNNINS